MFEGFPGGTSCKETACLPMHETLEMQVQSLGWEDPLKDQTPPGSQASSRGQAKDAALLSSRDAVFAPSPKTL